MRVGLGCLAVAGALLAGCVEGPGLAAPPGADFARFADEVQPVLAARCASPSCHGDPARPLMLYAPYQHRLDPTRLHLDAVLDEEEVRRNYDRVRGFLADPDACLLLLKPLARAAGGVDHVGGAQFLDAQEHDFSTLYRWIRDAMGDD